MTRPTDDENQAAPKSRPAYALTKGEGAFLAVMVLIFLGAAGFVVLDLPGLMVADAPKSSVTAASVAAERASIRTAGLAALAALGAGVGLFYTHRNYKHQVQVASDIERDRQEQAKLAQRVATETERARQREARLAQRTFVAERFNDAIKQLSETGSEQVRVAGAYNLGSVAEQDVDQRQPVIDVATSVIRTYTRGNPSREPIDLEAEDDVEELELTEIPQDIRAAAVVLLRLGAAVPMSLVSSDFAQLDLSGASLSNTLLYGVNLWGANLSDATLKGAQLSGGRCGFVDFRNADLRMVNFTGATLYGSKFDGAQLEGAVLSTATLQRGQLTDAQLAQTSGEPRWMDAFPDESPTTLTAAQDSPTGAD